MFKSPGSAFLAVEKFRVSPFSQSAGSTAPGFAENFPGLIPLEQLGERFQFATEAAGIGYWFCDLPFDKLIWDARVKEHFWLAPDAEVDIDLFYSCLHPEDRERTRAGLQESIETRARYDIEYRTVSPAGEIRWVRAVGRTAYNDAGAPVRFDGITLDLTPQKRIESELRGTEDRIRVALQHLPVILYTTDRDLRYTWIYRSHPMAPAEMLLGRRDDEIAPGIMDELLAFKQSVLDSGRPARRELSFVIGDRTEVYDITAEPLLNSAGEIAGLTVAALDITQARLTEHALRRTEKLAVVGRLASSIAHEINNPLESVVNTLFLMRTSTDVDEIRDLVRIAEEELSRVSHIVTHSLRFNRQSAAPTRQEISALTDSALALFGGRLRNTPIRVVRDYRPAPPLLCFSGELRQVFANLIGNALDATRSGALWVRIREAREFRTGEPAIRVTVADSGSGIDERTLARLFEPFVTTKQNVGTGLGLWVTAEILKRHNATVRVRTSTRPGSSGTAFVITFPLDPCPVPPISAPGH